MEDVGRPTPRLGSTRSLKSRLKISDQSSSAATLKAGRLRLSGEDRRVGSAAGRQAVVEIDAGVAQKSVAHGQALRRLEGVGLPAAKDKGFRARDMGGEREKRGAVIHDFGQRRADPVPLEHRKFRARATPPLAIAEDGRQRKDSRLSRGQEFLHREFGRRMQIGVARRAVRPRRGPSQIR